MSVASYRPLSAPPPRAPAVRGRTRQYATAPRGVQRGRDGLISWSMAPFYRQCGRRWPRAVALGMAAFWIAAAQPAAASPGPGPLAHAPGFRLALGQQVLAGPYGVALDPKGDVWVADTGHDRVVEFAPSGRLMFSFAGGLEQPEGIAVDATGHVWVADTGHDRVVEFSPAGRQIRTFGSAGSGPGQLDQPVALAIAPFGDVW